MAFVVSTSNGGYGPKNGLRLEPNVVTEVDDKVADSLKNVIGVKKVNLDGIKKRVDSGAINDEERVVRRGRPPTVRVGTSEVEHVEGGRDTSNV